MARQRPDALTPNAVLGLQRLAGNAATVAAVAALSVQRKATCVPTAVDRATYLASGGPRNGFGLTKLSGSSLVGNTAYQPVIPHPTRQGRFIVSAKVPTLGTIPSIYNKPEFIKAKDGPDVPYRNLHPTPGCPDKNIPLPWNVTQKGSAKMAEAEKEHCRDFQRAYDITLGRFAKAAKTFKGRVFRSPAEAEVALGKKSGVEPKAWGDKWEAVASKTLARDEPADGEHVPRIPEKDTVAPKPRNGKCSAGVFNVTEAAFPNLNSRKSVELINW